MKKTYFKLSNKYHLTDKKYILNVVDIVVQLKRGPGGKRFVSEVYFKAMHGN